MGKLVAKPIPAAFDKKSAIASIMSNDKYYDTSTGSLKKEGRKALDIINELADSEITVDKVNGTFSIDNPKVEGIKAGSLLPRFSGKDKRLTSELVTKFSDATLQKQLFGDEDTESNDVVQPEVVASNTNTGNETDTKPTTNTPAATPSTTTVNNTPKKSTTTKTSVKNTPKVTTKLAPKTEVKASNVPVVNTIPLKANTTVATTPEKPAVVKSEVTPSIDLNTIINNSKESPDYKWAYSNFSAVPGLKLVGGKDYTGSNNPSKFNSIYRIRVDEEMRNHPMFKGKINGDGDFKEDLTKTEALNLAGQLKNYKQLQQKILTENKQNLKRYIELNNKTASSKYLLNGQAYNFENALKAKTPKEFSDNINTIQTWITPQGLKSKRLENKIKFTKDGTVEIYKNGGKLVAKHQSKDGPTSLLNKKEDWSFFNSINAGPRTGSQEPEETNDPKINYLYNSLKSNYNTTIPGFNVFEDWKKFRSEQDQKSNESAPEEENLKTYNQYGGDKKFNTQKLLSNGSMLVGPLANLASAAYGMHVLNKPITTITRPTLKAASAPMISVASPNSLYTEKMKESIAANSFKKPNNSDPVSAIIGNSLNNKFYASNMKSVGEMEQNYKNDKVAALLAQENQKNQALVQAKNNQTAVDNENKLGVYEADMRAAEAKRLNATEKARLMQEGLGAVASSLSNKLVESKNRKDILQTGLYQTSADKYQKAADALEKARYYYKDSPEIIASAEDAYNQAKTEHETASNIFKNYLSSSLGFKV